MCDLLSKLIVALIREGEAVRDVYNLYEQSKQHDFHTFSHQARLSLRNACFNRDLKQRWRLDSWSSRLPSFFASC
jgi:hypothetical protein